MNVAPLTAREVLNLIAIATVAAVFACGCHPFESVDGFPQEEDVMDIDDRDQPRDLSRDSEDVDDSDLMDVDNDICACIGLPGEPCDCPDARDMTDPPDLVVDGDMVLKDMPEDEEDGSCTCPDGLPFGMVCDPEDCALSCEFELTPCDGLNSCVNTETDSLHCGGCFEQCAELAAAPNAGVQQVCRGGECRPTCDVGFGDCDNDPDNGCETTVSESPNCGACGVFCDGGTQCVENGTGGFECGCPENLIYCPSLGGCIDNNKDSSCGPDCETLGRCEGASFCRNYKCESCPGIGTCSGGQVCDASGGCLCEDDPACTPPATCCTEGCQLLANTDRDCGCEHQDCAAQGRACCQGRCVDYSRDPFNCGSCGASCQNNQVCEQGSCVIE